MAALLDVSSRRLTREELDRMSRMIEEARKPEDRKQEDRKQEEKKEGQS
jgi:hypothetical protein